jgi:hypothetical protein
VIILNQYGIQIHFHANCALKKLLFGIKHSRYVNNAHSNIQYSIILQVNVWKKIVHLGKNGILLKLNVLRSPKTVRNMKITHSSSKNVSESVKITKFIIKHRIVVPIKNVTLVNLFGIKSNIYAKSVMQHRQYGIKQ